MKTAFVILMVVWWGLMSLTTLLKREGDDEWAFLVLWIANAILGAGLIVSFFEDML